jgi:hypothetical protein
MGMYEDELEQAIQRLEANGRAKDDFSFEMSYLEPDPDGGGMFTVQYQIQILDKTTDKGLLAIGGIGSDWVGYFEEALKEGFFA